MLSSTARDALRRGEFVPYFQPIIALRSGKLIGFEALARWRHPQRGLIGPAEFVDQAEQGAWARELTRDILGKALKALAPLPGAFELAINVTAEQLHDRTLPQQVQELAQAANFSLHRLCIEVTETGLISDLSAATAVAHRIKEIGCKLALDDFGTGFSSLRHVQVLPLDMLKIDRSFVSAMETCRESRKIVATLVGLGQSLNIRTVAEGVESVAQDKMLHWLGCDQGQGWLYGKPVPAEALEAEIALVRERPAEGRLDPERRPLRSINDLDSLPALRFAQLRAVYDGAPVGLAFVDRDLRFVTVNRAFAEMNGTVMEEHLSRSVEEVIPDLFPAVEPLLRRALAGEPAARVAQQSSGLNPGKLLAVSYEPARDEAGEVLGISVSMLDLTTLRNAEASLREAEDHLRHVLDLSPHIPWVLDAKGRALDVSRSWVNATGRPEDSWREYGWLESLHPEDVARTKEVLDASLRSGVPIDVRYRVRPKGGAWTWMRARGFPRHGADGEILYWYGVLERELDLDSTEQAL